MSKRERLNENFLALLEELEKKGVIKGRDYLVALPNTLGVTHAQFEKYFERTKHITFLQAISFCSTYEIPEKKMFIGISEYGSEIAKESIPSAFGGPIIPADLKSSVEVIKTQNLPGEQQFRVIGISMEPWYAEGKIVAGKKLEKPLEIRDGWVYVIDNREGIRLKRLEKMKGSHFKLLSDNQSYYEETINFDDYPESKIYEVRPQEGLASKMINRHKVEEKRIKLSPAKVQPNRPNNRRSVEEKRIEVTRMIGNNRIEAVCEIFIKHLAGSESSPIITHIIRDFKVIQQNFQKKTLKKEKKEEEEIKVVDRLFAFLKDLNDKDWEKIETE